MERVYESIKIYRTTYEHVKRIAREDGKLMQRVFEDAIRSYIEKRQEQQPK